MTMRVRNVGVDSVMGCLLTLCGSFCYAVWFTACCFIHVCIYMWPNDVCNYFIANRDAFPNM